MLLIKGLYSYDENKDEKLVENMTFDDYGEGDDESRGPAEEYCLHFLGYQREN